MNFSTKIHQGMIIFILVTLDIS